MAKKDVSVLVSAAGWVGGFVDSLVRELRARGVTDTEIHALVTEDAKVPVGKIADGILEVIRPQKTLLISDTKNLLADWQLFWHELGIKVDFTNLVIPPRRKGFDRLLIIPQGLTIEGAYKLCAQNFKCWRWTEKNFDEIITHNDRDPKNGSYAIWVRDRVEADEELRNLSADDLTNKKIPGITLLERLVYESKYFKETGNHLDINNWTLCTGSRYCDGGVPSVGWAYGEMFDHWFHPDSRFGDLRTREAVS